MRAVVGGGAWLVEGIMIAGVALAVRLWQLRERGRQVESAIHELTRIRNSHPCQDIPQVADWIDLAVQVLENELSEVVTELWREHNAKADE